MKTGQKAPKFKLKDKDDTEFSLRDIETEFTVLFFYPKDNTPGCTIEAKDFSKNISKLTKAGVTALGISGGDNKSKEKFCTKYKLKIPLLSDSDFSVSKEYGVYGPKSFMGRKFLGISRTTFLLDKSKKIIKIFEKVSPLGHVNEILEEIKNLKTS